MRARAISRNDAPLACALGLALIAATAGPGRAETTTPPAPPAAAAPASGTTPSASAQTAGAKTTTGPAAKTPATATQATATTAAPGKAPAPAQATGGIAAPAGKPAPPTTLPAATAARPATAGATAAATTKTATAKKTVTRPDSSTAATGKKKDGASESDYTLRGGQEGTVFKSLTVEGEDRVHVDFERPELKLDLDLEKAPGLDWGSAADVLNRTNRDLDAPLVGLSAKQTHPYLGRPWLSEFATGPVARFHPAAEGVASWKLIVVDSKGATVRTFWANGDPPKEIDWDGRSTDGTPVTPGLTYSYVFEARDKAGNKRNVVGPGFTVSAYRIDGPGGPTLLFAATELQSAASANATAPQTGSETPTAAPILLEAASWLNQTELSRPLKVTATARSQELADALANNVKRSLAPLVLGDPTRLDAVALVEPDAPEGGTITIAPGK
jgi:hypothetical protein